MEESDCSIIYGTRHNFLYSVSKALWKLKDNLTSGQKFESGTPKYEAGYLASWSRSPDTCAKELHKDNIYPEPTFNDSIQPIAPLLEIP